MKKLVFSAIALTAFSFSALANNEVKEEKTEVLTENISSAIDGDFCFEFALNTLNSFEEQNGCEYSDSEAIQAMNALYAVCWMLTK